MNRVHLKINGIEGYTDKEALLADFEKWIPEYREAWLRDNKESQIGLIEKFVREIALY